MSTLINNPTPDKDIEMLTPNENIEMEKPSHLEIFIGVSLRKTYTTYASLRKLTQIYVNLRL